MKLFRCQETLGHPKNSVSGSLIRDSGNQGVTEDQKLMTKNQQGASFPYIIGLQKVSTRKRTLFSYLLSFLVTMYKHFNLTCFRFLIIFKAKKNIKINS